jgi:thiamine-monophosphate kinase
MSPSEIEFVRWLRENASHAASHARVGIGDDMAVLDLEGATVLLTTDMLLDGIHFRAAEHTLEQIGRKAVACSLSDCAAMAARPIAAAVSVAMPAGFGIADAKQLLAGMRDMADAFECEIIGGDTTAWNRPMAIDVCMIAIPYPGIEPALRSGARPGDVLGVTGRLGGSLRGHHLTFTPRVREGRAIAEALGRDLHAMMDLSDGLSLDLARMCEASGVGARLEALALADVASADALEAAGVDGRPALEHLLNDGEDFELLVAVAAETATPPCMEALCLHRVGVVTVTGLTITDETGGEQTLEPRGYDHFHG